MNRRSRLLAALFVPAAVALVWLALSALSPWSQAGPVIRLQVGTEWERSAMFDSRAMRCVEQERATTESGAIRLRAACELEIAGKPLAFSVQHDGNQTIGGCSAAYAGAPVPCKSAIAFYNSQLPAVRIESDLGLEPASLRGLPGTNPIFYISEGAWFWAGSAIAAGIAAVALWLYSRRPAPAPATLAGRAVRAGYYLFSGALLYGFLWYAMLFVTLTTGLVD